MGRLLRLTDRFQFDRSMFVQPRTPLAAGLAATLGRLLGGLLPGPLDFEAVLPIGKVWVRRVPAASLWIYYDFTDTEVTVYSLDTREPIHLDG